MPLRLSGAANAGPRATSFRSTSPSYPPSPHVPGDPPCREGTTVNTRHIIAFQRGAFIPAVAVQPICLHYPYCQHNPTHPPGSSNGLVLLASLFQVYNRMVVTYLPPYTPTPEEAADAGVYAAHVGALMARTLGRTIAPYTDHDALLVDAAKHRDRRWGDYMRVYILPSASTRMAEASLRLELRLSALEGAAYRFFRADSRGSGYLQAADVRACERASVRARPATSALRSRAHPRSSRPSGRRRCGSRWRA